MTESRSAEVAPISAVPERLSRAGGVHFGVRIHSTEREKARIGLSVFGIKM